MEQLRPLLFSIAYRMLASASEAEDVVQEAFLRYQAALADGSTVESTKAYLSAVVTRLAIDELKSARKRRETYSGQWLSEPAVTDHLDPESHIEEAESLSMAFLLLLDRLTPVERAVFLLHDVFAYEFSEIAAMVAKTEANCRQIAVRARRRIHNGASATGALPRQTTRSCGAGRLARRLWRGRSRDRAAPHQRAARRDRARSRGTNRVRPRARSAR
jgi:RNA polymerase sigma factor (sigma-70 family)